MIAIYLIAGYWAAAPVETENNQLDETERSVHRRRTRVILIIEIVAFAICMILGENQICKIIALSVFTESVMLVAGILQGLKMRKNKEEFHE